MNIKPSPQHPHAYSRVDVLLVLLALAVVAGTTHPVWGNATPPRSLVCMDNLRRLTAAWFLYADDNAGEFAGNYHGDFLATLTGNQRPWASGWLDWSLRPDNTNTTYFTAARSSAVGVYLQGDVTPFRCPSDNYVSASQAARGWSSRARSYAMNCYLGEGNQATGPIDLTYPIVKRQADFRNLPPQRTFVFTEEHPDSMNDPLLFVNMSNWVWTDMPGSFHDGACWFSFADGHLESRAWTQAVNVRPVALVSGNQTSLPPNSPDLLWVRARTTAR